MGKALLVLALLLAAIAAWSADAPSSAAKTVTISASDQPIGDVLKQVAKATGETILVEKLVSGDLTAEIKDATAETALEAIAKSGKLEWRKIYVADGSVLARDADALAAQMRTVLSVRFPDILISEAGSGGSFLHVQRETAANAMIKIVPASAGFKAVYLVTDDQKAYKKDLKDEAKRKVKDYVDGQKKTLQSFLEMSPEERKQALRESISMAEQMDPRIMAEMINSMSESDPEFFARQGKIQIDALMSMDTQARKNLLRMSIRSNMEMMKNMPPELMQQLQEEAMAAAAENAAEKSSPNPPSGE